MTETQVHDFIYDELDLSGLVDCVKSSTGLDDAGAAQALACYRDFLWVCWYHWNSGTGDSLAAIDAEADAVWHCHMLQPVKYQKDCAQIFGGGVLLDHQPGGGPDAADEQLASAAYVAAGLAAPADPRKQCVWSVVAPS